METAFKPYAAINHGCLQVFVEDVEYFVTELPGTDLAANLALDDHRPVGFEIEGRYEFGLEIDPCCPVAYVRFGSRRTRISRALEYDGNIWAIADMDGRARVVGVEFLYVDPEAWRQLLTDKDGWVKAMQNWK